MKALILAAGVGSRLRPMTSNKPKCLVRVAGRPILDHQIQAYAAAGIKDLIIVAGYEADKVSGYCRHLKSIKTTIIENLDYENTNNMYSLYLARHELAGHDFLLSNGDVVFDPVIIRELVSAPDGDLIAVDPGTYSEESMKVTVGSDGILTDISKGIPESQALGNSIDLYRFSSSAGAVLFDHIVHTIEVETNLKDWTEVAIQNQMQQRRLEMRPFDIQRRPWVEIDNYVDLALADKTFSGLDRTLSGKRLFFVDLDGTIYLGDRLIDGAQPFVSALCASGKQVYFLSNNSSRSKRDYVEKLRTFDIPAEESQIILSTDSLIHHLLTENVKETYVLGTDSMLGWIESAGINPRSSNPEYVVVGYDTELTYEKLRRASIYLSGGADLLATHCDVVCPTPEGPIPDAGAILALLEATTGKRPLKIFGKPSPEMILPTMTGKGISKKETVVIGDRVYTDLELARRSGCDFILVLSGETKREDVEALSHVPELIVNSLGDIQK